MAKLHKKLIQPKLRTNDLTPQATMNTKALDFNGQII